MTTLEGVTVGEFHITDGRVTIDAGVTEADLTVRTPSYGPLSGVETHAYLTLAGEDYRALVELNAADCEALAAALAAAPDETEGVTDAE